MMKVRFKSNNRAHTLYEWLSLLHVHKRGGCLNSNKSTPKPFGFYCFVFQMQSVFEVYPVVNGSGAVKFAWQKSVGNYLAISGLVYMQNCWLVHCMHNFVSHCSCTCLHSLNKIVNIYDRHGEHRSDVLMVLPG